VLAILGFVVGIAASVASVSDSVSSDDDTVVALDGQPHHVTLSRGERGYLWRGLGVDADPSCAVTDDMTGRPVRISTSRSATKSDRDDSFEAFGTFDAGSGNLTVTCAPPNGGSSFDSITVGPDPHIGRSVAVIMATIFVPGLLGLAGVVALIVTAVLWFTRPPRQKRAAYAGNQPPPPGISPM